MIATPYTYHSIDILCSHLYLIIHKSLSMNAVSLSVV